MSESRILAGTSGPARSRPVRPMVLALAQIGCAGILISQPVHAMPHTPVPAPTAAADEPVLYLAQAASDYSKMPAKRPTGVGNAPPPPPPTGSFGSGGGSTGSNTQDGRPASGSDNRALKR